MMLEAVGGDIMCQSAYQVLWLLRCQNVNDKKLRRNERFGIVGLELFKDGGWHGVRMLLYGVGVLVELSLVKVMMAMWGNSSGRWIHRFKGCCRRLFIKGEFRREQFLVVWIGSMADWSILMVVLYGGVWMGCDFEWWIFIWWWFGISVLMVLMMFYGRWWWNGLGR